MPAQLALSQEDLTRERARLTSDIRETSRRVEEEFEHKLSLQKQKLAALDKQNRDLKFQVGIRDESFIINGELGLCLVKVKRKKYPAIISS